MTEDKLDKKYATNEDFSEWKTFTQELAQKIHDIQYGNLLENIEHRLYRLEDEDRSLICPNHEELKIIARMRRIETRIEELGGIVKEFLKLEDKEYKDTGKKMQSALGQVDAPPTATDKSYLVEFDKKTELWRSTACTSDTFIGSAVGHTPRDAFDNLIVKI